MKLFLSLKTYIEKQDSWIVATSYCGRMFVVYFILFIV